MRAFLLATILGLSFLVLLAQPPEGAFPARVTRWVDGDTCMLRFTETVPPNLFRYETIRLLGVNAPEVGEPFADEATQFFRKLTMGKQVYVELNPYERRDLHNRLLAYLWVETEEGWTLVNEALLRAGLARLLVFYPEREKYYCRFLHALTLAQLEGLGLWESAGNPRELWEIEADPVRYVTQAVSAIFEVSRVGLERQGWALWAAGSRYGLRAVLDPGVCRSFWNLEVFDPAVFMGKKVLVTGELLWDSLGGGPRIVVRFPEQLRLWEENP